MGIIVGAALGACIGGALVAMVLVPNWTYARKNGEAGTVAGYGLIGGAVLGAVIGAFL